MTNQIDHTIHNAKYQEVLAFGVAGDEREKGLAGFILDALVIHNSEGAAQTVKIGKDAKGFTYITFKGKKYYHGR